MNTIDSETLCNLQFSFLTDRLSSLAFSPEGKKILSDPEFMTDAKRIEYTRDLLSELLDQFAHGAPAHMPVLPEISSSLAVLQKKGSGISGEEIWHIRDYCECGMAIRAFCRDDQHPTPLSAQLTELMPDTSTLIKEISSYLIEPGVVREDHPRIRAKMQKVSAAKHARSSVVSEFVQNASDTLQSSNPVFRESRLVLPVKSKDKQRYPGILHASSQSGNTLFIEPFRLMEKNNDVASAEQELLIEIERIYRELSALIAEELESIAQIQQITGEFDRYFTMAVYSRQHAYTRPMTCDRGLTLKAVRHPILQDKAIPIDITIDPQTSVLVMSGPNAGGKTVTLKTIGFAALMNQIGMYLPASDGCELPVFSSIYTDIGDEQSIERELSTFSGHIKRISSILQQGDDSSLIILDELGSGTDPVEGAALAQSILEYCSTNAGMTLVTSHHAVLKQFAYARAGIINASMEFNEQDKAPTYRVILGEPGESHALDTAMRMQMPRHIIDRSIELLGSDRMELTAFMKELKKREQDMKRHEQSIANREQQLRQSIRETDLYRLKLRQKELLQKRDDTTQLQKFIRESRSTVENLIRELREQELTKERIKQVQAQLKAIEQTAEHSKGELEQEQRELTPPDTSAPAGTSGPLSAGMRVSVKQTGREGTILQWVKKDQWLVELDNGMRLSLAEQRIAPLPSRTKRQDDSKTAKVHVYVEQSESMSSPTVDVRGCSLQEAIERILIHIDKAVISDMHEISIIHGKGEGILQRGIHDELAGNPAVKEFHLPAPKTVGTGRPM